MQAAQMRVLQLRGNWVQGRLSQQALQEAFVPHVSQRHHVGNCAGFAKTTHAGIHDALAGAGAALLMTSAGAQTATVGAQTAGAGRIWMAIHIASRATKII